MKLLQAAAYQFSSDEGKAQMIAQWAARLLLGRGYLQGQVGNLQDSDFLVQRHRRAMLGELQIEAREHATYNYKGTQQVAEQIDLTIKHKGQPVFNYVWDGQRPMSNTPRLISQPVTSGRCKLHVHGDWVEDLYAQLAARNTKPPLLFRP